MSSIDSSIGFIQPQSFASVTVFFNSDVEFSTPSEKPSTAYSPSCSVSFDGECIFKVLLIPFNNVEPILLAAEAISFNPLFIPFIKPFMAFIPTFFNSFVLFFNGCNYFFDNFRSSFLNISN